LDLEPYYIEKQFNALLYVKYNTPTPVSNNDNAVQGMCSVFYHDGPSNTIKYIDGTYLSRYIATTRASRTVTRIICGNASDPVFSCNIIIDNLTGNQVIVNECNLPLVLFEDENPPTSISLSDAAAIKLGLLPGTSSAEDEVNEPTFPYVYGTNGIPVIGNGPLLANTYGNTSLSNDANWTTNMNKSNGNFNFNFKGP
jgi:hypothetical protein